jgi:hypothetical protein
MMKPLAWVFPIVLMTVSCAVRPAAPPTTQPGKSVLKTDFNSIESLHVRLTVNPTDGSVTYFGWYDGRRNLLGTGGIMAALVGMEPPELQGELTRGGARELVFQGIDQNQIAWVKHYRLDDSAASVTYRITNRRNQAFDAIIYSLADFPDATITGDNRDQYIQSPIASAHFHADILHPNFPGEQMNPYALRSESRRLEPGESMEFHMTWELGLPRQP